ncbi:hypothetical protein F2P79_008729 [Pimephales promelas]|nr:hypothetical protein F2P79_008729 [Pimephales promelas]
MAPSALAVLPRSPVPYGTLRPRRCPLYCATSRQRNDSLLLGYTYTPSTECVKQASRHPAV